MEHTVVTFLLLASTMIFSITLIAKILRSKGALWMFPGLTWGQVKETLASLAHDKPGKYESLQIEEARKLNEREEADRLILTNGKVPAKEEVYVYARRGF